MQNTVPELNLDVQGDFYTELAGILSRLHSPGPFYAYIHGDPAPDNWLRSDGHLKLIDYEFGYFKSGLLDGVYGRMMFPTAWCNGRIPDQIVERMEHVYRSELVVGCPEAEDHGIFLRALTEACAHWAWDTVFHRLELGLADDDKYGNKSVWRSEIMSRLNVFVSISQQYGHFDHVRRTSYELLGRLRHLWSETELDYFPAFRS